MFRIFRRECSAPLNSGKNEFILVDVSDPKYFESFVIAENIVEILDHHFGFEEYWTKRLGNKGCVEHVGSYTTLIWERFKAAGVEQQIGPIEANLLYTAIFANTLGLSAQVTS